MGSIYKIGNEYFIEFYARGLKYQQKAGPDGKAARKTLEDIEAKLAQGEVATIVRDVEYDLFFHDYRQFVQDQHTVKTIKRYTVTMDHFVRYLQNEHPLLKKLSEITPKIIEQYKFFLLKNTQRNNVSRSINLAIILLTDIFQYAIKLGYLNDNPALHIRLVPQNNIKQVVILTDEEIRVLEKSLPKDWRVITEFLLLTGMRLEELPQLKWNQVDWSNQCLSIALPSSAGFHLSVRTIPLHPQVTAMLKELQMKKHDPSLIFGWLHAHQDAFKDYWKMLQAVFKASGSTKRITWQTIRHTFAVNLIQKGVRFSALYKFFGENDIAKMMIYVKSIPDHV